MKSQKLYKEIGLIDENLIEAAEQNRVENRRTYLSKKWIACVATLMIFSSVSTALLAREYYENKNAELYIRYLTLEDMELVPTTEYDADKFFRALRSDNEEYVYIAINRLVECFNDNNLREKALKAIEPLMKSNTEKIADAATFAVDILSKKYESPFIYNLADGSKVFTLFNNYSDYGSQNVLWRIKDNELEQYLSFSKPSMYIKQIIPSPDQKLIAVVTCSNKSEFIQIIDPEEGRVSPELVESARVKYGAQNQLDTWIRIDYENYSYVNNIEWKENDTLGFEAVLAYDNAETIENINVTYKLGQKLMKVEKSVENR